MLDYSISQSFDTFEAKRGDALPQMPFREVDGLNFEQKCAVYSILAKAHHPYPFVLFGPPGTGKTGKIGHKFHFSHCFFVISSHFLHKNLK
jgi:hypothetical protein